MSGALVGAPIAGIVGRLTPTIGPLVGLGGQLAQAAGIVPAPVAFLFGAQRKIGTIIPDVVITEHHVDRTQITQHPVMSGTPISDHAFMLPQTLTMQCGFSNSSVVQAALSGFASGGGFSNIGGGLSGAGSALLGSFTEQRVKDIYTKLQKLQQQITTTGGTTFAVTTGKRTYTDMAITELSVTTDRHSEYALFITVGLQQVIMVSEQTTTASAQQSAMPGKTAPTVQTGAPQANPNDSPLLGVNNFLRSFLPSFLFSPTSAPK